MRPTFLRLMLITMLLPACTSGPLPTSPEESNLIGTPSLIISHQAPVTITFGTQGIDRPNVAPLAEQFERENPDVHVQLVPLDDILGGTFDETALHTIAERADTALIGTSWFEINDVVRTHVFMNLTPLIDGDVRFDKADYFPGTLPLEPNGAMYGLPRFADAPVLLVNQQVWNKTGLPEPQPEWSWNQLLDAAERLAQQEGGEIDTYGYIGLFGSVPLPELLAEAGVQFPTDVAQVQVDQPAVHAVLERLAALIHAGAVYKAPNTEMATHYDQIQQLVVAGRVAMWEPENVADVGTLQVSLAPRPFASRGQLPASARLVISNGTQQRAAAWRWLQFLSRQPLSNNPEGRGALASIPARRSVAEASGYWSRLDERSGIAGASTFLQKLLDRGPSFLPAADWRPLGVLDGALDAMLDGQNATAALTDAQQQLAKIAQASNDTTSASTATAEPIVVITPAATAAAEPGATAIIFRTADAPHITPIADAFNRANRDVFVQVEQLPPSPAGLSTRSVDGADCFSAPGPLSEALRAAVLDVQPLLDADQQLPREAYPAALLDLFRSDGKLYGLPDTVRYPALSYNRDLFDRAGVAYPTADWGIADLVNAAEQLHDPRNGVYGYAVPGAMPEDLQRWLRLAGVSPVTESGDTARPNYTDPALVAAIQSYVALLRSASPHTRFTGYRQDVPEQLAAYNAVLNGRAGLWLTNGDYNTSTAWNVARAAAPLPQHDGGLSAADLAVSGLYINVNTTHPHACWRWLASLSGDVSRVRATDTFPARTALAQEPSFLAQQTPGIDTVLETYLNGFEGGALRRAPSIGDIDFFWLFQALDQAMQGQDLPRALAAAQATTAAYLACVQGGTDGPACARQVDPTYTEPGSGP